MSGVVGERRSGLTLGLTAIAAVGAVISIGSSLLVVNGAGFETWVYGFDFFPFLIATFFAVFVWLIAPAQPRNPVVWTMAAAALFSGLTQFGSVIAWILYDIDAALFEGPWVPALAPPGAAWLVFLTEWMWVPAFLPLVTLGILLFPDGRLPSRRARHIAYVAGAGMVLMVAGSMWDLRPGSTQPSIGDSPVMFVAWGLSILAAALSLAALAGRYRRSSGEERHQIKWILWGTSIFATVFLGLGFLLGDTEYESLLVGPIIIALTVFLISYGVAVGKYRLYDIDVVISRSVVFAVLAAFITLTYALIVVGIGRLIGGDSAGLFLPIAATALVATAFEPVRASAQRWANRFVYGKRATPYEVLSALTERLSGSQQGEGLLERLALLLREGTGAELATVWLGSPGEMAPAASSPHSVVAGTEPRLDDGATFAVSHDGEVIGALQVTKPKGAVLSDAERVLITDLAGSASAILGYQRLNDSLAAKARELEESRARLVGAQDQERRKLERELHEGAEQYIVALKVKLGVASQLAAKAGASPDLVALLGALTEEAQAALDDVRSLAKGIYPPILESDGLEAAVSALAKASPVDIRFDRTGIGRYPAEVEAAIYFDISEAVTNAVKHASPPIRIELSDGEDHLRFSVTDAGPGFDVDRSVSGSGMENMADRLAAVGGELRVVSGTGLPTVVSGEIPVRQLTPT